MLPEINKNWAEIGLTWSALEQSKIALRKRALPAWENKLRAMEKGKQVSLDQFPVIKAMVESEKGMTSRIAFLAPAGLDPKQKRKWISDTTKRIFRDSGAQYGQETMNRGQLHKFMQAYLAHTNLDRRLAAAYKKAEQKRHKLGKKVLDPNNNIAQYYAH